MDALHALAIADAIVSSQEGGDGAWESEALDAGYLSAFNALLPPGLQLGQEARSLVESLMLTGLLLCLITFLELRRHMPVLGNVLLGLETRGIDRAEAEGKAREYLKGFGLSGFENAYPKTLSGGMRQRVALIRTLIMDPDILLLDEPFSALDYQTRLYLEGVLKDAVETYNKTVILVTHDIDEAVALSKRVIVLSGRPARVKVVHDIDLSATSPIAARSDARFSGYFHALCAELDIQTEKTA